MLSRPSRIWLFLKHAMGVLLACGCLTGSPAVAGQSDSAVVGATLVDVGHAGHSTADIPDSVVLIAHGRIVAIGGRRQVQLPSGTQVIDATGEYLIPGLIDGYGAVRNSRYAAAYLYEGVTTVVVPTAPRNAAIDGESAVVHATPGPSVVAMAPISGYAANGDVPKASPWTAHRTQDKRLDAAALKREVADAATAGARIIAAEQDVWPDQLGTIVAEAHRHGMAVAAQPTFTTYDQAIKAGVDAFTRNDHYSLGTVGPALFADYANDPQGPGARPAVRAVCQSEHLKDGIAAFGGELARSGVALMPILSMEATADDVGGPNPWSLRSAAFFKPADLDDPVDPVTGARPYLRSKPERRDQIRACARSKQAIDRGLHAAGAIYLAGTAAPSFGVMPGGGLHVELRLLESIGLTPREALSAATGNIASRFRLSDRGMIAPGRRADLVLLRADPRRDASAVDAIAQVIFEGRVIDRAALRKKAKAQLAMGR